MPAHPTALSIGKILIGILWIVTGSCFFVSGDSRWLEAGRLVFQVTAAAHVVECVIFFPTLNEHRPNSTRTLGTNLLLTLVFGVFHYATLKFEALAENDREPPGEVPTA